MSSEAPALTSDPSSTPQSQRTGGFAETLRESTKSVHREAERSGFIADLIRGRASCDGYALFLRNLVSVYASLEAALDARGARPLLLPFADLRLRRLESLRADLIAMGSRSGDQSEPVQEASAYAAAIDRAAAHDDRLAAHAYARYMGDLSGGQVLKPLLARTLGLGPDMLSFYDFPTIRDLEAPKAAMRRALDRIVPGSPQADAIVDEAIAAFQHNIALSVALSRP